MMEQIAIDIVMFISLAAAFAFAGCFLTLAMGTQQDLLGFIPDWVERKFTPEAKIYKLITCEKCLSGQIALWWLLITKTGVWRIDYCFGIVCTAGVLAGIIMKKL